MNICMDELLRTIATALDAVEGDLLGASTHHGKRIATLCTAMGRTLGLSEDELFAVSACALLHDNALTEYILSERPGEGQMNNLRLHSVYGQRNVEALPFKSPVDGFVLYHHEMADGSGPFRKKEGEYPLGAELIAISDMLDVSLHLQRLPEAELPALRESIGRRAGTQFTHRAAKAMLDVLDEAIVRLAGVTARIIDYKSKFTRRHTVEIADRAWWMAGFYGMSEEERAHVYLAAALHDLGKLFVPTEVLEKPGKLTDEEFAVIKSHAYWTREMLKDVSGLEVLCEWAANHHEKLDGSGYPLSKEGQKLDFISRLLACVDIYQAVSEERPYHPARTHAETMPILYDMAEKGQLDPAIVRDMDVEMAKFEDGELPHPEGAVRFAEPH